MPGGTPTHRLPITGIHVITSHFFLHLSVHAPLWTCFLDDMTSPKWTLSTPSLLDKLKIVLIQGICYLRHCQWSHMLILLNPPKLRRRKMISFNRTGRHSVPVYPKLSYVFSHVEHELPPVIPCVSALWYNIVYVIQQRRVMTKTTDFIHFKFRW